MCKTIILQSYQKRNRLQNKSRHIFISFFRFFFHQGYYQRIPFGWHPYECVEGSARKQVEKNSLLQTDTVFSL